MPAVSIILPWLTVRDTNSFMFRKNRRDKGTYVGILDEQTTCDSFNIWALERHEKTHPRIKQSVIDWNGLNIRDA